MFVPRGFSQMPQFLLVLAGAVARKWFETAERVTDAGGGCRHPSVAREYWTRYCSVECQRTHWAAGHKDECPCAKDLQEFLY